MPRFALLVALVVVSTAAAAVPVTMTFTASGFAPAGAPQDPVSGSVTWEAAGFPGTITALTGINLTIDGHAYTLGEIGFVDPFSINFKLIGGVGGAVTGLAAGTDDFQLFMSHAGADVGFAYTSSNISAIIFSASSVVTEVIVGTSVPAPMTLVLFGLGLAGLAASRYRRPS